SEEIRPLSRDSLTKDECPQTVGFVTFILGTLLAVNSRKLALHGLLTAVIYVLFPFAEEPWLRDHHGDAYEEYCEQTPRFLSRESISNLFR
ncbi:MAG: isoprenylcysteine carboxylmethyltransferase family protein, partial [Haloglomus sp.]